MSINWEKIFNKYKGKWVALLEDQITVVGSGKTAKQALTEAEANGHKKTFLTRIPEKDIAFVGFFSIYK